jgi:hypothetical protein
MVYLPQADGKAITRALGVGGALGFGGELVAAGLPGGKDVTLALQGLFALGSVVAHAVESAAACHQADQ